MLSQSKDASLGLAHQSKIYTWDGVILYVTHEQLNNAHAHFPALLQISLGTPFAITLDDQLRRYHDIVVMATQCDAQYRFRTSALSGTHD